MTEKLPENNFPAGYEVPKVWTWDKGNGGQFANEDGTALTLNSPEAVQALQAFQDLISADLAPRVGHELARMLPR